MSIIAYAKRVLAADSRALHQVADNAGHHGASAYPAIKLKVFDQALAIACAGGVLSQTNWKSAHAIFKSAIMEMELDEMHQAAMDPAFLQILGMKHNSFILMTKKGVYYISAENASKDGQNGIRLLDPEQPLFYGSGSRMTHVAVTHGYDAKKAVEFTVTVEPTCGGEVLSVRQQDLLPLIQTPKPVPPKPQASKPIARKKAKASS
jgi:hypothetical protein